jgi:hypothetical protein
VKWVSGKKRPALAKLGLELCEFYHLGIWRGRIRPWSAGFTSELVSEDYTGDWVCVRHILKLSSISSWKTNKGE